MTLLGGEIHLSYIENDSNLEESLQLVNCKMMEDGRIVELKETSTIDPVSCKIINSAPQATIISEYLALSRQSSELWYYANCSENNSRTNSVVEREEILKKAVAWGVIEEHIVMSSLANGTYYNDSMSNLPF